MYIYTIYIIPIDGPKCQTNTYLYFLLCACVQALTYVYMEIYIQYNNIIHVYICGNLYIIQYHICSIAHICLKVCIGNVLYVYKEG